MTIIISGSRTFDQEGVIRGVLSRIQEVLGKVTFINGDARGADRIGASIARNLGWDIITMPAEWDRYGKSAGHRRNEAMRDKALEMGGDIYLVAFADTDGDVVSTGTRNMVEACKGRPGIKVAVYNRSGARIG